MVLRVKGSLGHALVANFLKLFPREVFQLYMAAGYSFATVRPNRYLPTITRNK